MNEAQPIKSKNDINKLKKAAANDRDRLLITFGVNTGLRISDIIDLKVGDLFDGRSNQPKKAVKIKEKKSRKTKTFTLNQTIAKDLKKTVKDPTDREAFVFQSRRGNNGISRIQAHRILAAAAERAGLDYPVSSHSLRKTFGYHAYNNGVDLTLLMKIFNHSSQEITLRYIGIQREDIDAVYDGLAL
ncbi:integrase family protein (plasmid) [Halobacillus halophilus DSM 2266]|uniref:Integrase family protein n=1 Tax=Halobacillus halophilus (strain ATCC 35676 / DSM 2266 / JCM 20832 / KCTC 3685 / LMG 17431 / NBRC 102448 / NCIMB 2269) TaxID=866895 RepID=I0JTN7_HALH3|nr:tyrosine-type recombinase/integrase [Halobacillus halophilus]CCG47510.1 integrase family protein [Halobacillus halophilus DSM 2266]